MKRFNKTNWIIIAISCLVFFPRFSYSQQSPDGFYIIISTKKCPNLLKNFDSSKFFCVPNEPIIAQAEFERVSKVMYDSLRGTRYLLLELSNDGFKTLKMLTGKLPNADLALVVDNKVAGVFDNPEKILNRIVPILGGSNRTEIDWIYNQLRKDAHPAKE